MPIPQELLDRIARNEYTEYTLNLVAQIGGEEENWILNEEDISNLIPALNENKHIKSLLVAECSISAESLSRLFLSVTSLRSISACIRDDEVFRNFSLNETLEELSVASEYISRTSVEHLVKARNLRKLDLSIHRIDEESVEILSQHGTLEELSIFNSNVNDRGVTFLARSKSLKVLNLAYNQATDEGARTLSENTRLLSLGLAKNHLTDACIPYLTHMRSLIKLDVSQNAFTASGVKQLYESGILEIDASNTMQARVLTFGFDAMQRRTLYTGPEFGRPEQFRRTSEADITAYCSDVRVRMGVGSV